MGEEIKGFDVIHVRHEELVGGVEYVGRFHVYLSACLEDGEFVGTRRVFTEVDCLPFWPLRMTESVPMLGIVLIDA